MGGEAVSVGQPDLGGREEIGDPAEAAGVVRVAGVEVEDAVPHAWVGAGVDLVGGGGETGQTAGHVAGPQALGGAGEVGEGEEAAVALAEGLPGFVPAESAADQFGVGDDRVGAEVAQVCGELGGRGEAGGGSGGDGGGTAGAALVEQEHPVGLECLVQPAG